jgi:hypothetical protein
MNGYALVRARFPQKIMSPYVYEMDIKSNMSNSKASSFQNIQAMIMSFTYHDEVDNIDDDDWSENELSENDSDNEGSFNDFDDAESEEEEDEVDYGNNDDVNLPLDMPHLEDAEIEPFPHPPLPNGNEENMDMPAPSAPLFVATDTEVILQIPDLIFNDNWFEFSHHWQFLRLYPTHKYELFELDDLPDPRLYNIDVTQLRTLARRQCTDCGGPFDPSYEGYLFHVEPTLLATSMMENYIVNCDLVVQYNENNILHQKFKKPNPMMFVPTWLDSNPEKRKAQINRALNKFVIVVDIHIEARTWYDTLDNVYWGIGTGDPTPKLSWLRYLRWRRYFLHLKLSGITRTPEDNEPIKFGPPYIRDCDKERMGPTNCFALTTETGQFASNSYGCHRASDPADPFPKFPNVDDNSIILYQYKSIWSIDLNDFDCNTKWNFSFKLYKQPFLGKRPVSIRQAKILQFIDNRIAEWGSKSNFATAMEGSSENNGGDWFMSDVSREFYAEEANSGWQVERPAKQQKLDKDEA